MAFSKIALRINASTYTLGKFGCLIVYAGAAGAGIVLNKLAQQGSSLAHEMKKFSFHGRICAMKGLLQAVPQEVLTANLTVNATHVQLSASASSSRRGVAMFGTSHDVGRPGAPQRSIGDTSGNASASGSHRTAKGCADPLEQPPLQSTVQYLVPSGSDKAAGGHVQGVGQTRVPRQWSLLSDGALLACCEAVRDSTDAHHKFHAVSALAFCLDRIKQCLQVTHTFSPPFTTSLHLTVTWADLQASCWSCLVTLLHV